MALNYNTENFSKNVKVLALRNDELGNAAWWYSTRHTFSMYKVLGL